MASASLPRETGLTDRAPRISRTMRSSLILRASQLGVLVLGLALWELASGRLIAAFWISSPSAIAAVLSKWISSGFLLFHLELTMEETVLGMLLGSGVAIVAAFILGLSPFAVRMLDPLITALYSVPKLALAPMFVLYLGVGVPMKVVFAATIVFFLVFASTLAGVRETNRELIDCLRVMGASKLSTLWKVTIPSSLPWIYVGLKLSLPQALVGAVIGEIIAANRGLGFLIGSSAGLFDTTSLFAAVFVLMIVGTLMNEAIVRAESMVMPWKK